MSFGRALQGSASVVLSLLLLGCSEGEDVSASAGGGDGLSGELVVFAASSLTDAFDDIGDDFAEAHPDVSLTFSYAASSSLSSSIVEGAPADVFASANPAQMDVVAEAGLASDNTPRFARNGLQIVVPARNLAGVESLDDFDDEDLLIGLCAEEVPCGDLARELFKSAGITPAIDTNEPDVRSLLTKVAAGELDAGLVYRTDVLSAGDVVTAIDVAGGDEVVNDYPIAALAEAPNPDAAQAFVDFVLSEEGQSVLAGYGFLAP